MVLSWRQKEGKKNERSVGFEARSIETDPIHLRIKLVRLERRFQGGGSGRQGLVRPRRPALGGDGSPAGRPPWGPGARRRGPCGTRRHLDATNKRLSRPGSRGDGAFEACEWRALKQKLHVIALGLAGAEAAIERRTQVHFPGVF